MCAELPKVAFLAMDARHCAGTEMADLMAYAASVGSERARRKLQAVGFIGNATDATAHYFGQKRGFGTMPHSLIGYAGSTSAEEHTSELQALMRISYAVLCLIKKKILRRSALYDLTTKQRANQTSARR